MLTGQSQVDAFDDYLQIAVLGYFKSGKSSLISRFVNDDLPEKNHKITRKVKNSTKKVLLNGKDILLNLCEISSGSGEYEKQAKACSGIIKNHHAVMITVYLWKKPSLEQFERIFKAYQPYLSSKIPVIFVATKSDISLDSLTEEEINQFKQSFPNNVDFIQTSAYHDTNVTEAFMLAAQNAYEYKYPSPKIVETPVSNIESARVISSTTSTQTALQDNEYSISAIGSKKLNKESFKYALQQYKHRIESQRDEKTNNINFAYGFCRLFRSNRALNREVNYHLAQKLLEELETHSIKETFDKVDELRRNVQVERGFTKNKFYFDFGINSTELNEIIYDGQQARRLK